MRPRCSARDGALYFSWKALQLPVGVLDYLVLHELCHLVHSNHGPEFWALLERALPSWRERRDELHEKGKDIYWCAAEMQV